MNSEQLQKWALVAEVIGGFAVVVTLVFLIAETRANTNAIQSQTYQELTFELNEVRGDMANEFIAPVFSEFMSEGMEDMEFNDQLILTTTYHRAYGVYESAYYARERGILGESEWERFERLACINMEIAAFFWIRLPSLETAGVRTSLTEEFADYLEDVCDWASISASQ